MLLRIGSQLPTASTFRTTTVKANLNLQKNKTLKYLLRTVQKHFIHCRGKWHERTKWPLITIYYHLIQLSRTTYHSHSVHQWNQRDIDTGIFSLWIQTDRYRCVGNGEYHRHSLKEQKSGLICRGKVTPNRFYQASTVNSKMMVMMGRW